VAEDGHEMTIPHFCNNIDDRMSDRPSGSDGLPHVSGLKASGIFLLLTVVFTWPQAIHWLSVPDFMDTYFSMWRLSWIAHQLTIDPRHLFDANIFYPLTHTLNYSDAVLLQGLAGAPLLWAGVPAVAVYNLLVFTGFVASGLGAFLLVRDLTRSSAAGLLAGTVFAFAPFRFDHYVHLELLWAQFVPLTLWMVHRTIRSGRWRDGLWTGLFVALQGLSCVYYTVFMATILLVLGPILISTAERSVRWRAVRALLAGAVLAAVILAPYARSYQAAREEVGERGRLVTMLGFSVGPKHYLATPNNNILYGAATKSISVHEKRLFMGFLVMALVVVGLWPPINRVRVAYALALIIAIDVSFAQRGILLGWLYDNILIYRGLRVPARFGQIALLGAGVLAGFGLVRVIGWTREHRAAWVRPALTAIAAVVALEYLMFPQALVPIATAPNETALWLRTQPPGPIINLPVSSPEQLAAERPIEPLYQYESIFHWRAMFNGYSGNAPAQYVLAKPTAAAFPTDTALATLRQFGIGYAIVHERYYGRTAYRDVVAAAGARGDLIAYGPFADGEYETRAYRILK